MALQGDLRTMDLQDLLQWLAGAQISGILRFRHRQGDIEMRVSRGTITDIRAATIDRWAESLVGRAHWRKAVQWAERERQTPEEILQRVGVLPDNDLEAWRLEAARRALRDLLLWDDGWFHFQDAQIGGDGIDIAHLMLDVAVELDEREHLRERFGDSLIWLEQAPNTALDDVPDALAELLRGGIHLVEIPWLLADGLWANTKLIDQLVDARKVLTLEVTEPLVDDPVRAYQEAIAAERSFRYEEAAEKYEQAITAAWEDAFSHEAVDRWIERYVRMLAQHLFDETMEVRAAREWMPHPGDPYANYALRVLDEPRQIRTMIARAPFHRFFVLRSLRRLATGGTIDFRVPTP